MSLYGLSGSLRVRLEGFLISLRIPNTSVLDGILFCNLSNRLTPPPKPPRKGKDTGPCKNIFCLHGVISPQIPGQDASISHFKVPQRGENEFYDKSP